MTHLAVFHFLPYSHDITLNSFGPARAFALGLALLSAPRRLAQKTTVKAKNSKVKTKTTANGSTVSKTKLW